MPTINRKRRARASPSPAPPPTRRRRSPSTASSVSAASAAEEPSQTANSHAQMVKKLIRLALASEYSRQAIRRTDIASKVMAPHTSRQFKHVFASAQEELRSVFGMELTELPQKEKVTVGQKRAAQRSQASQASSTVKAWVLTSTLPVRYRQVGILSPARIPSSAAEAAYTGLVTFVLAIIYLAPARTVSESRLEKQLKRMNADTYVLGGEKTEKVLKRMEKEGYVIKYRERDGGGEETVDYVLGARGKVEVGERGVAGLVRTVYAKKDLEAEELERRLVRSLGDVVIERKRGVGGEPGGEEGGGEPDGEAEGDEERSHGANRGDHDVDASRYDTEPDNGHGRKGGQKKQQPPRRSSGRNQGRRRVQEEEVEAEEDEGEDEEEEDGEEDEEDEEEEEETDG